MQDTLTVELKTKATEDRALEKQKDQIVIIISHQIFTLYNDTILRANDTLYNPGLTLIFAPCYHNLLDEYISDSVTVRLKL